MRTSRLLCCDCVQGCSGRLVESSDAGVAGWRSRIEGCTSWQADCKALAMCLVLPCKQAGPLVQAASLTGLALMAGCMLPGPLAVSRWGPGTGSSMLWHQKSYPCDSCILAPGSVVLCCAWLLRS